MSEKLTFFENYSLLNNDDAKYSLLIWCQRKTKEYEGVEISDFYDSWINGLAFNALLHEQLTHILKSDVFDFHKLTQNTKILNLNKAFDLAERFFGIKRIFSAEGS